MAANGVTILCVDDEDIPRTLRTLVLQKQGYEVVAVASAAEALEVLERGGISLVLTDQMMPRMTGTELAKRVKAMWPGMPVIVISGLTEITGEPDCVDRFVSKVEGPDQLFRAILEVLAEPHQTG